MDQRPSPARIRRAASASNHRLLASAPLATMSEGEPPRVRKSSHRNISWPSQLSFNVLKKYTKAGKVGKGPGPSRTGPLPLFALFRSARLSVRRVCARCSFGPWRPASADGRQGPIPRKARWLYQPAGTTKKPRVLPGAGFSFFRLGYFTPPPRPSPVCSAARISTGLDHLVPRYELAKDSRCNVPGTARCGRLVSIAG